LLSGAPDMIIKRRLLGAAASAPLLFVAAMADAQEAPIINPGAPGHPSGHLTPEQAVALADSAYSPADVMFMQGMIVHHQQAVDMVDELIKRPGTAADPVYLEFTDEIERMNAVVVTMVEDSRKGG